MTIHVVTRGDTVYSIAQEYGVSMDAIISDNELTNPSSLVPGQTLVILYPDVVHIVRPGDTLFSIARNYSVSVNNLFMNNTFLNGISTIYPGQRIVISYKGDKKGTLTSNGYAYPFIDRSVLRKTLPFLTYLTPFTYGFRPDGTLLNEGLIYRNENEKAMIDIANEYNTKSLMHLSTIDETGVFSSELATALLGNTQARSKLIGEIIANMSEMGYVGVDVDFEYIPAADVDRFTSFIADLTKASNENGYITMVALAPKTSSTQAGLLYEGHDYAGLGNAANFVLLMTYEWGYAYGPPMAVAPLNSVERVVDYALTEIPAKKIFLGIPNYGYDWTLPFVQGESRARSLSNVEAVQLAIETGSEIQYDETAASPFFTYTRDGRNHVVWFEDARSIQAKLDLARRKGLYGASWWNIMKYFPQNWLVLNAEYNIRGR